MRLLADADLIINTRIDNSGINKGTQQTAKAMEGLTKSLDDQLKTIREQKTALADMNEQLKLISSIEPSGEIAAMETQQKKLTARIITQKTAYNDLITKRKELLATYEQQRSEGAETDKLDTSKEIDKIESKLETRKAKILDLDRQSLELATKIANEKLIAPSSVEQAENLRNKIAAAKDELEKSKEVTESIRNKMREIAAPAATLFEPGDLESIVEPIRQAETEAVTLGKTIQEALQPESISISEPIIEAITEASALSDELSNIPISEIIPEIESVGSAIFDAANESSNISDNIDDIIISSDNMNQEFGLSAEYIRGISREADRLADKYNSQVKSIKTQTIALDDMKRQYEAIATGAKTPASLIAMESQQKRITAEVKQQQAAYSELIAKIQAANEQLTFAKGAGRTEDIIAAQAEVQRLDAESIEYAETLDILEDKSSELAKRIAEIKMSPETSAEAIKLKEKITLAESALTDTKDKANETKAQITEMLSITESGTEQNIKRVKESSSKLNNTMQSLGTKIKNVFSNISSVVIGLGTNVKNVFSKIGGFVSKSLSNFKLLGKETGKTSNAFERLGSKIKTLVLTAFVFQVLRTALRKLREDLGNVLMRNAEFASSLNAIKVNLLTAFAPIWQAIEPAIISFMNVLAQATAILAQFMAMIFGQTIQQARASAQALNDQSKALTGVGKAGEKASVGLQKFDDVNQAAADTATSGADTGTALDFAAVEPPDFTWLEEFKNKLLEIIPDLDYFYNLGAKLADAINTGLDYLDGLDWPQIERIANSIGQKLGAFLSGAIENIKWDSLGRIIANGLNIAFAFLEGLFDTLPWEAMGNALASYLNNLISSAQWKKWGETLGKGINGVLKGLNAFFKKFDWKGLGNSLAIGLQSLIDTINWNLIGETFANGINGILTTIYTFFTTYDWVGLGASIANSLNTAISTINWQLLGSTLASIIQSAVDAAYGFVTTFEWGKFGDSIGESINSFFSGIEWGKAGKTLSDGFLGALNTIGSAVRKVDWQQIGNSIASFMSTIKWSEIVLEISRLFGNALGGLAMLLYGAIKDSVKEIGDYFEKEMESVGGNILLGFLKGVNKIKQNVMLWVWEFVSGFIDGFKEMFGIHSPSKVMEGLGVNIMEGLFNGIKTLIDSVVALFSDIWQGVQNIFMGVAQWFDDVVIQPIISFFEPIVSTISGFFGDTWQAIKNVFESPAKWFSENVIQPLIEVFNGIVTFVKDVFTGNWESAWKGVTNAFDKVFGGIKNIAKGIVNGVIDLINSMISAIISGINFMISAINKLKIDVPEWVPGIGGSTFGFNIPKVSAPQIPRLATGAVLPPNKPFMALMGEQRNGTNLEAPEGLIRQIMQEEIQRSNAELANMIGAAVAANLAASGGIGNGEANFYIDSDLLARATFDASQREQNRRGINLRPIAGVL